MTVAPKISVAPRRLGLLDFSRLSSPDASGGGSVEQKLTKRAREGARALPSGRYASKERPGGEFRWHGTLVNMGRDVCGISGNTPSSSRSSSRHPFGVDRVMKRRARVTGARVAEALTGQRSPGSRHEATPPQRRSKRRGAMAPSTIRTSTTRTRPFTHTLRSRGRDARPDRPSRVPRTGRAKRPIAAGSCGTRSGPRCFRLSPSRR